MVCEDAKDFHRLRRTPRTRRLPDWYGFRPLPYEASVFKVEDWYTRGDTRLEEALFAHAAQAIRYIGCDELWVADDAGDRIPPVPVAWVEENKFTLRRYKKK